MRKIICSSVKSILVSLLVVQTIGLNSLKAQVTANKTTSIERATQLSLAKAVETDMKNLDLHNRFIRSFRGKNQLLDSQYVVWAAKYPYIREVPFAIGRYYAIQELSQARDWLFRTVKIDSLMAEAWVLLSYDAGRRGDRNLEQDYLLKALNTGNATSKDFLNYAYYYKNKDQEKFHTLLSELIQKFKGDPNSAWALSLIAQDTQDKQKKKVLYDSLYNEYSGTKLSEAESGLSLYFLELLDEDPRAAHLLVRKILDDGKLKKWRWVDKEKVARQFFTVDSLLLAGDMSQASKVADSIDLMDPHKAEHIMAEESLLLLKAKVNKYNNLLKAAYDSLILYYSKKPSGKVFSALLANAGDMSISRDSLYKDIWKIRDSLSKPATDFSLVNFLDGQKVSLSDLKGKVVLLTYWFPGCGPCRKEFPFFEKAVRKYAEDVKYVGINLINIQDDYVVSYMKSSGYTFIPLQNDPKWAKGTLHASGAPVNFLIDRQGRIIFSHFFIDEENYNLLETMIAEMIDRG